MQNSSNKLGIEYKTTAYFSKICILPPSPSILWTATTPAHSTTSTTEYAENPGHSECNVYELQDFQLQWKVRDRAPRAEPNKSLVGNSG